MRCGDNGVYTYAGAKPIEGAAVEKEVYTGQWKDNLKHGIGK